MPEWLPPQAPGGQPPPQFEPGPPHEAVVPAAAPAQPAGAPPTFVRGRKTETNGLAVAALVLSIAGLVLLVMTLGLGFIITLPCSIAGWICAAQARNRINLGETTTGRGQAQAAYVLGIIGVVVGVMAAVGWIAAIASGLDLEELQRDLERRSNPEARQAVVQAARALLGR
jgi:hypothetical protein